MAEDRGPAATSSTERPRLSAVDLLQAAFERRDRNELEALARAGVALEIRDASGRTVLMRAAEAGDVEALEWILQAGAAVDRRLGDGRSALFLAAAAGHDAVVDVLLAAGADLALRDDDGADAISWARRGGWHNLADRLTARRPRVEETPSASTTRPHPIAKTSVGRPESSATAPRPTLLTETSPPREPYRAAAVLRSSSAVADLRGLGDPQRDDENLLVAAPPDRVASTLVDLLDAAVWLRDAYGREIVTTPPSYLVFRFLGQRWTVVRPAHQGQAGEALDTLARRLSRRLPAPAMVIEHRPSRGRFSYGLFDAGRVRESLDQNRSDGLAHWPDAVADDTTPDRYDDRRSDVVPDAGGDDPTKLIHHLLCRHRAYAPSWGRLRGMRHRLEIAGLSAGDFERLDFVARFSAP